MIHARSAIALSAASLLAISSCHKKPARPATPKTSAPIHSPEPDRTGSPQPLASDPMAPGLWLDADRSIVEFAGEIAVDAHHPDTPNVYLEMVACSPDTREHESLVVTRTTPSLIHAALLAAGFVDGTPGQITPKPDSTFERTPPAGDDLLVELLIEQSNGTWIARPAEDFIVHVETRLPLASAPDWSGFVFAGSAIVDWQGRAFYDADGSGLVIALVDFSTTRGSRSRGSAPTVAAAWSVSESAGIDEPVWIANRATLPKVGTPVRVRLSKAPTPTTP